MIKALNHYEQYGWVHLKNIVPDLDLQIVRSVGKELTQWVHNNDLYGKPAKYGSEFHWQGVGCASKFRPELFQIYTSKYMHEIATNILGDKIYLFNDQIVYKMPFHENFKFEPHTDNALGPNTDNRIHTVNLSMILDDFTEENGALEVMMDGEYIPIYAKAGDVVAIRGDTFHRSSENKSDKPRGLYACVYADEPMDFHNYYKEPFYLHR